MQKLTPEEWRKVFELLDQALDVPAVERDAWLAALDGDAAPLKDALIDLLQKHTTHESSAFLRELPNFTQLDGATPNAAAGATVGAQIGPYRLVRELGRGGMGTVWLAERVDGTFKRSVALKLPHLAWVGGLAERMARERNILAGLEHPNIARLYDAGFDDLGRPFMAMEYVEGKPIDKYCIEHQLSTRQRLELILQVAHAVTHAHGRLVVHRDLKPANILVTPQGSVRLLDFGIATLLAVESPDERSRSHTAVRALTPDYASPEQITGEPIGTATDGYSLAVICYELLTGRRPYRLKRDTVAEAQRVIAEVDALSASDAADNKQVARELRGDLDAILNRALKKEPTERYATVDAFAQDIERYLHGVPVQARPDSRMYRVRKFIARHRAGAFATLAVVIAVVAGTSVAVWQAREARAQARQSEIERDTARRAAAREAAVRVYITRLFRASAADKSRETTTAKDMLDKSAQRVLHEYRDDPQLVGKVVETLADLYGALEDVEGQVPLLEGFLAQAGPEADPESVAVARQKLAAVELARGNIPKAAELLDQSEAFWKRDSQRYADLILEGLLVRGQLQRAQNDLDGSITTYELAVRARTLRSGLNNRETATLYNSLAISYQNANRPDDALKAYQRALAIHQALGSSEEVEALVTRANMGALALRSGRLAEAQPLLHTAYEKQRALSGDSAAVAAAMGLYGAARTAQGQYDDAIAVLQQAVDIGIRFTGESSPLAVQNRLFLADALRAGGRYDAAQTLYSTNLRLTQKQFGPAHIFVQRILLGQARLDHARGAEAKALDELDDVIPRLRKLGVPGRVTVALGLTTYGDALLSLGRAKEAIVPLTEALTIRESSLWNESWEIAEAQLLLGEARVKSGDAGGHALITQARSTLNKQLGPVHALTKRAAANLD
jgi:tetratricopeptide (TPR) repeat protein/predicted Ser/Thr protein kinase